MKIGLIVNPIAGMGGKVALKGTDNVLEEAKARGAERIAPTRAVEFLRKLRESVNEVQILACPSIMGENEARTVDFAVQALPMKINDEETTAKDTEEAVRLLILEHVDLIVFVGGDGTAKDILDAMQNLEKIPVLGVPSGVKMYSGIFAINPSDAAEVALAFIQGQAEIQDYEIIDADENAIRKDAFNIKLYGFLKGPYLPTHIQGSKQVSPETEDEQDNQKAIAKFILEDISPSDTIILGPGTTTKQIADLLGTKKTLLGVDIYKKGKAVLDVGERKILEEVENWQNTWVILSPIGHQGILLGRGNQQISPEIIKRVGKGRIIVAVTKSKLHSIEEQVLRVDSGDAEVDNMLKGFIRVVTDYREWRLVQVE